MPLLAKAKAKSSERRLPPPKVNLRSAVPLAPAPSGVPVVFVKEEDEVEETTPGQVMTPTGKWGQKTQPVKLSANAKQPTAMKSTPTARPPPPPASQGVGGLVTMLTAQRPPSLIKAPVVLKPASTGLKRPFDQAVPAFSGSAEGSQSSKAPPSKLHKVSPHTPPVPVPPGPQFPPRPPAGLSAMRPSQLKTSKPGSVAPTGTGAGTGVSKSPFASAPGMLKSVGKQQTPPPPLRQPPQNQQRPEAQGAGTGVSKSPFASTPGVVETVGKQETPPPPLRQPPQNQQKSEAQGGQQRSFAMSAAAKTRLRSSSAPVAPTSAKVASVGASAKPVLPALRPAMSNAHAKDGASVSEVSGKGDNGKSEGSAATADKGGCKGGTTRSAPQSTRELVQRDLPNPQSRQGRADEETARGKTDVSNGSSVSGNAGGAAAAIGRISLEKVLAPANLGIFADALSKLGVEEPSDLRYVTPEDLKSMNMSVIQSRKFDEVARLHGGDSETLPPPPAPSSAASFSKKRKAGELVDAGKEEVPIQRAKTDTSRSRGAEDLGPSGKCVIGAGKTAGAPDDQGNLAKASLWRANSKTTWKEDAASTPWNKGKRNMGWQQKKW